MEMPTAGMGATRPRCDRSTTPIRAWKNGERNICNDATQIGKPLIEYAGKLYLPAQG